MKYLLPFLAGVLSALSVSAQNIGIGTKTPKFPLDIAGTTRMHSNLIAGDSGTLSSKVSIIGALTSGGIGADQFKVDAKGHLTFSGESGIYIDNNKYALLCNGMPSEGLFMNGDLERWEFRDDKANPYFTINDIGKTISVQGGINAGIGADQFKVDAKGHLTFSGESGIYVDNNKYALLCNGMPSEGLFMNGDLERWEFRDDKANPYFTINDISKTISVQGGMNAGIGADQFKVDAKGHLTFSGESGIYIDHNKYAILCNDMPAEGLFMNGDLERWEFRDENGSSFFHAGGANYDIGVRGGVQLGNTTSIQAGMMRFKDGEFQGYNGTEWRSFSTVKANNQSVGNSTVLQELETLRLQVENLSQQLKKLQATQ